MRQGQAGSGVFPAWWGEVRLGLVVDADASGAICGEELAPLTPLEVVR